VEACHAAAEDPEGTFTSAASRGPTEVSARTVPQVAEPAGGDSGVSPPLVKAATCHQRESTNRLPDGSTSRWKCCRKSMPMMEKLTPASKNVHVNWQRPKRTDKFFLPQQGICLPQGPVSNGPVGLLVSTNGKIEKLAPVLTKKRLWEMSS
jgi:hypothetical protein